MIAFIQFVSYFFHRQASVYAHPGFWKGCSSFSSPSFLCLLISLPNAYICKCTNASGKYRYWVRFRFLSFPCISLCVCWRAEKRREREKKKSKPFSRTQSKHTSLSTMKGKQYDWKLCGIYQKKKTKSVVGVCCIIDCDVYECRRRSNGGNFKMK